ncbi:gamma-glutamylcyclotransferase-like [Anthonomus grandis grandis]|uniref:gamma-glutamylcyclotransferase-like n=1 Tax=Anthonomus grandis grandis TaxID=2921223 RepID=UPI0021656D4E|nr:gamma-glutamylcyclotransferase-like [Anthonomus grandis grandis]
MSVQKAGKFLYFAYGSNLLKQRIHIQNPSAERAGIGFLKDYQISFVTHSKRWQGASATIIPKKSRVVWGALWYLDNSHMESLDGQEGVHKNLYRVLHVDIELPNGEKVKARTYQQTVDAPDVDDFKDLPHECRPSFPYLRTILVGAEESDLPKEYREFLQTIPHNGYDGPVDIGLPLNFK